MGKQRHRYFTFLAFQIQCKGYLLYNRGLVPPVSGRCKETAHSRPCNRKPFRSTSACCFYRYANAAKRYRDMQQNDYGIDWNSTSILPCAIRRIFRRYAYSRRGYLGASNHTMGRGFPRLAKTQRRGYGIFCYKKRTERKHPLIPQRYAKYTAGIGNDYPCTARKRIHLRTASRAGSTGRHPDRPYRKAAAKISSIF